MTRQGLRAAAVWALVAGALAFGMRDALLRPATGVSDIRTIPSPVRWLAVVGVVLVAGVVIARVSGRRTPASSAGVPLTEDRYLLSAFGLYCALTVVAPRLGLPTAVGSCAYFLGPLLALAWIRLRGGKPGLKRLGVNAGASVRLEVLSGLRAAAFAVPLSAAAYLLAQLLAGASVMKRPSPFGDTLPMGVSASIAEQALMMLIWAPVTEELLFRGALLGLLRRRLSWILTACFVSAAFAVVHRPWNYWPIHFSTGFVFASVMMRRGSFIGPAVVHCCCNLLPFAVMLTMRPIPGPQG